MPPTARLRVAIIGSGPSGFYAIEHLLRHMPEIEIDLYDRLPTPFGLVRGGVAPDHQKIKSVTKVYEKLAAHPAVRFLGNVEIGRDLSVEELRRFYHAIIYAVGAHTDRALGVPGELLPGSHSATAFVGWYNGHPDFEDREFDLSQENVAVVGMGNVAVDVTRVLTRTPEELRRTDIAPYALEALSGSQVRRVYMLGRRGPVQAAFTNPELKELGEMQGADIVVRHDELELDPGSLTALNSHQDRTAEKNLATLRAFADKPLSGKPRQIHLRFLVSPIELLGRERVETITLGRNRLVAGSNGDLRAEPTGAIETLPVGLVFRSVGYLGTGIPGVAHDPKRGVIPHQKGRVVAGDGRISAGEYAVGWIKRGPTGVIGTNKPDSVETGDLLLEDFRSGALARELPDRDEVGRLLAGRGVRVVNWSDWRVLDALERGRGEPLGRPRIKFTRVQQMLEALDQSPHRN